MRWRTDFFKFSPKYRNAFSLVKNTHQWRFGKPGTAAVQLAAHFGAEVTGVCGTSNTEMVRSLGAHQVIDYTQADLTLSEKQYDIIYDTVGKLSFAQVKHLLTPKGTYMSPILSLKLLLQMLLTSFTGIKKPVFRLQA